MKNVVYIGLVLLFGFNYNSAHSKELHKIFTFSIPQNIEHSSKVILSSKQGKIIRIRKERFAMKTFRMADKAYKVYVSTSGKGVYDSFYLRNDSKLAKLESKGLNLYRNGILSQSQAKNILANLSYTDTKGSDNYKIFEFVVLVTKQGIPSPTFMTYFLPKDSGRAIINSYAQHQILKQIIIGSIKAINEETGDTVKLPSVSLDVFLKEEVEGFKDDFSIESILHWGSPKTSEEIRVTPPKGTYYRRD